MESQLVQLVDDICALTPEFERLSTAFRSDSALSAIGDLETDSDDRWRIETYGNALVRLRLITEQNFRCVETLGLLAVTRYVFELVLWLRLFDLDSRYAQVYRHQLLDTQRRYYTDLINHLHREVALLERFGAMDRESSERALKNFMEDENNAADAFAGQLRLSRDAVDAEAARCFSIHAEGGRTRGYGFQAHLVATKLIPNAEESKKQIDSEIERFHTTASMETKVMISTRWQWRQMALKVEMQDEYDFIYSFASKLLHCTPASITTNHKLLEPQETIMFLRYIYTKLRDVIEMTIRQPECRIRPQAD